MGKSLGGKELGEGLSQRKDGRFSARYRSKAGKRVEKYFDSVIDAKKWLEKAKYEDRNLKKLAPFDGLNMRFPQKEKSDIRFLSLEDEAKFFEQAKRSHNYDQYQFVRETGIRCGELIALCFSDIDWDEGTVEINKTMKFRYKSSEWRAGSPKTIAGYRTLPLTKKAYKILRNLYEGKSERFESEDLNQMLEFTDRKTGKKRYLNMKDLVFANYRTGMPAKNSSYNTHLYKLCEEAGIAPFSMHTLRHTYATRAIAAGVSPKALQKLLGHEQVSTSMDIYVGLSEDSKRDAVRLLEEYSNN